MEIEKRFVIVFKIKIMLIDVFRVVVNKSFCENFNTIFMKKKNYQNINNFFNFFIKYFLNSPLTNVLGALATIFLWNNKNVKF